MHPRFGTQTVQLPIRSWRLSTLVKVHSLWVAPGDECRFPRVTATSAWAVPLYASPTAPCTKRTHITPMPNTRLHSARLARNFLHPRRESTGWEVTCAPAAPQGRYRPREAVNTTLSGASWTRSTSQKLRATSFSSGAGTQSKRLRYGILVPT